MNGTKIPDGWSTGHHDGYYTKIIRVGNASIEINRPILTDEELRKREAQVKDALILFERSVSHG